MDLSEFLEHHGVKGMHWGIRNKPTRADVKLRNKRKKVSAKRRHLSDGDIKAYIERLGNEKKLKNLIDEDLAPGKTIAKRILSESGQKVARTVVAGAGLYALKVAVEKQFDAKEAIGYIAPKPKK